MLVCAVSLLIAVGCEQRHAAAPPVRPPEDPKFKKMWEDAKVPMSGMPAETAPPPPEKVVVKAAKFNQTSYGVAENDAPADSKRVLVVVNQASKDSRALGEYYAFKRKIPQSNVILLNCSTAEQINFDEFKFNILKPVKEKIQRSRNPIDFIVLTKGVPLRLRDANGYAVDAQIAAMNLTVQEIPQTIQNLKPEEVRAAVERCVSPYAGATERFNSRKFNMYLVTRLDGYTLADCKALVDHSLQAKPEKGLFFFDAAQNRNGEGYREMQRTLYNAATILNSKKFTARIDDTPTFVAPSEPLAGYASWGSNDGKFDLPTYRKLKFKAGALAETFVSTSGRTFEPTVGGQSLIADLIAQGVTGVKGYVSEPYVFALAQPDVIFDRYTHGFNLAESFYAATRLVKWKDVVIGDPLCCPYKN